MTIDVTQIILAVITLVGTIVTGYLAPAIKSWLNSKLTASQQEKLFDLVTTAVEAAEQMLGTGEEKKQYVIDFLATKGYTVDTDAISDEINALIEAAVYELKGGLTIEETIEEGETESETEDITAATLTLADLSTEQLKSIASQVGIEGYEGMTRAALITALTKAKFNLQVA